MASAGQQDRHNLGETSNAWECLNVWREIESTNCAWGCQQLVEDGLQCCWCDAQSGHKAHFRHELQGLQPYVSVNDYHEPPFPWMHDGGKFGIDLGVDHAFSILTSSRAGLSHEMMASNPGGYGHDGCGSAQNSQDTQLKGTPCAKLEGDRPAQDMASCETKDGEDPEGAEGTSSSKQMEARPFEESRSQVTGVGQAVSIVKSMGAEDVHDAARSGTHLRQHRGKKTAVSDTPADLEDKRAEDVDGAPWSGQNFRHHGGAWEETEGALCSTFSERPGLPGPADDRTLEAPSLLGGGKRGHASTMEDVLEDVEPTGDDHLTPGHLQDRMMILQQRAMEALQALPADCREDLGFGKVETRVWGLEALKHILKMRLALQSSLPLTRLVEHAPLIPPANELLAANLTLTIGNKGNRCYANTVLRLWCWTGAHHSNPKEFWGPSTNLCLQILQQDAIEDIFWASELQPALARLEHPQQQHDASEFLVHLWELWGQTGLQGNWHSLFGGREHEFDTIPLFIRMPVDAGEDVNFETLLSDWANEASGQCLGSEVEHIVFHVGRYSLDTAAKAWVKHHNRLYTPSSFRCPQKTSTGHARHSTFVLRGIIAHQGEQLTSGHYVAMLVAGDAVWTVDDGECPQVQQHVPEYIQRGAVMIWASKAEHSTFWTHSIGSFDPPPKRPRTGGEGIEVLYSNVTQWNRDAKNGCCSRTSSWPCWLRHMLLAPSCSQRPMRWPGADGRSLPWKPMKQGVVALVVGSFSAAGKVNLPTRFTTLTRLAMVSLPTLCSARTGKLSLSPSI